MKGRMLVAVDLGPGTVEAVAEAARWGRHLGTTLDLVHVQEGRGDVSGELDRLAGALGDSLGRVWIAEGDPQETLAGVSGDYDGIFIATRGGDRFGDLHLGAVAGYLLAHARCPVTVLRIDGVSAAR